MKNLIAALAVVFILSGPLWTWALDGQSIIDLKQAGLSDKTIQLIIQDFLYIAY